MYDKYITLHSCCLYTQWVLKVQHHLKMKETKSAPGKTTSSPFIFLSPTCLSWIRLDITSWPSSSPDHIAKTHFKQGVKNKTN